MSAVQDLQLSDNTVTRRIGAISKDMQMQLKSDLEICECFSLQFDKSTDIAQLAVMGKDKHIARMIRAINSFRAKLVSWVSHLKMKSLVHFPNMKKMIGDSEIDLSTFVFNFQLHFQQFNIIEPMVTFFVNPYTDQINVTEIATYISEFLQVRREEVEIEILDLQNYIILKTIILEEFLRYK
ncbi:DUF4371 domain-containing protein [Nephila pilipes]|uniref:DUF4371 domain-containing protein n=1 Tax=Nephila pilipes TaxID=299642 RepID=A0A8X6TP83_NEPPI|nr:DUF4371 domain-containing protein [Nephila pilipes]